MTWMQFLIFFITFMLFQMDTRRTLEGVIPFLEVVFKYLCSNLFIKAFAFLMKVKNDTHFYDYTHTYTLFDMVMKILIRFKV
jgi:hypothetical protein